MLCATVFKVRQARLLGTRRLPSQAQAQIIAGIEQRNYDCTLESAIAERVRDDLQQFGFYLAQVEQPAITEMNSDGTYREVAVVVRVNEGYQYRLGHLLLVNYSAFSADQLRAQIPIAPGDLFSTSKIRQGLDNLRKLYGTRGYLSFSVLPEMEVDRDYRVVNVKFNFYEGPQFRVSSFGIVGLEPDLAQTLAAAWEMPPGSIYSTTRLDHFFVVHRNELPAGSSPEQNSLISLHDLEHTVDVRLEFPN